MLFISDISKSYGARTLFKGVSFTLNPGDRMGIIGRNGTGKTTLLEIISGHVEVDHGEVALQKGATFGYLEQDIVPDPEKTLLGEVVSANKALGRLEHKRALIHDRLESLEDHHERDQLLKELGEIESHYTHMSGYTLEYEAKSILAGLGFHERDFDRRLNEFSGGWLMRAGLAKLLLQEPDVLMLDEPTNHLDLDAVIWLERFLQQYAGAVIVISHDKRFLNIMVNRILAFEPDGVKSYRGNYDSYMVQREKEREVLESTAKNQERFIVSQERFIERFRSKNTKAKQVQSRIRRLEKLDRVELGHDMKTMRLKTKPSPRSGKVVISVEQGVFGYDSVPVYTSLGLSLMRGERAAFVGPNGAGKSTLMKLMAGILPLQGGSRILGHNVQVEYYAQHQAEQLYSENNVLGELRRAAVDESDQDLRTYLGAFLFSGADVEKKVAVLSGGEKARLSLAKLLLRPANFILMDEPTNHLDMQSRDVLADALASYDGTLCLITHDRELIDRAANRIIEVTGGKVSLSHGNYQDYLARKETEQAARETKWTPTPDQAPTTREGDRERKRREAEIRNRLYREVKPQKNRVAAIEKEIATIDRNIKEIEIRLADPAAIAAGPQFNGMLNEYERIKARKASLEEEWLGLETAIEEARVRLLDEP